MSNETISMSKDLLSYIRAVGVREDSALRELRAETASQPMAIMQISPEQGQFMSLLLEILGARRAIEIGTFTGYSAMWIAKGLGPTGHLVALDISEEYTRIARRHWAAAGLAERIELRVAPAVQSLEEMVNHECNTFDFVFIDADKPGYDVYYEYALRLLRSGGVAAFDNALMEGGVINPADTSADSTSMRAFNQKLYKDPRVSVSLVPISDGLYLARKR